MPKLAKESRSTARIKFFELVFQDNEGLLCIGTTEPLAPRATYKQTFWEWPRQVIDLENYILRVEKDRNVYFGINLLSRRERKKEYCLPTDLVWADLDEIDPMSLKIPPPIVIESSRGRYQAIWRLSTQLPPYQAEDYSRRIAYSTGADLSGWDLTQLLRVPFTVNFKYEPRHDVTLIAAIDKTAPPLLFEALETVDKGSVDQELPEELPGVENVIYKYQLALRGTPFVAIYTQEPEASEDWSKILWRLIHICLEAGMSTEETFVVANAAPCNKYARDMRPIEHLWKEVLRAQASLESLTVLSNNFKPLMMPTLVPNLDEPIGRPFIQEYREWAEEATDAVPVFHDLSCMIMLSAIVSGSVRLHTSYGVMTPNLWGLVLGDSTIARKTTSMQMVVNILNQLDPSMVMATDGSPEGLLTGLEGRPNKVSIFYKDEVSGFFDSINRKEYLAGMPETLTALYDVPPVYTRLLRKSTVRIESPAFIFFGGGVSDRVYDALTEEYILSGFIPRFLVVNGENSLDKLRRTGPPSEEGSARRAAIVATAADLYEHYATEVPTTIGGQQMYMPPRHTAELTQKAWNEYGRIEELMVQEAASSSIPDLALPTFERLSRSLLKMSLIFGAVRQTPKSGKPISISDNDVRNAAFYIQDWGRYSVDLVTNSGKKTSEKMLDKVVAQIRSKPGVLRSQMMQHFHLSKREADEIFQTLEDRMIIRKEQQGRGYRYYIA